jgi:methylmalonyl-CoA mutase
MPGQQLTLAADFPTPSRENWRSLVAEVLAKSGAAAPSEPETALTSSTYDGIVIKPLYGAGDARQVDDGGQPGRPPFLRGATSDGATTTGWDVRVRHADPDAAALNAALRNELETGATSAWLVLGGASGLAVDDLPRALDGVPLDRTPVVLDAGADTTAAAQAFLAVAERRGVVPETLRGSLGADPIGTRARRGGSLDVDVLAAIVRRLPPSLDLHIATIDATVYHDAGASDAQELGIGTAVGVAYLRTLTDAGLSIDAALRALEFRWAVTADQFASIAKLRAARRIWDRVAQVCEASGQRRGQWQHASTSAAMLTRRDPWVNMLRTTIGCFAAAVGGADAITVLPFDAAIGVSDDFARRIARNTSSVLHDESSLGRVVDAAGGSWFVESVTDELAERAWSVFTHLERYGGAARALEDGRIGELIGEVRLRRAADIAHRRAPITGVSEFAFVEEAPVLRSPLPEVDDGGLLPRIRYAEDYEALRDRADAAAERPHVFLAALGPLAASTTRASFARNLFAAGGITAVTGTGDAGDVEQLAAAFRAAGTRVACLCSSDDICATDAAAVITALRTAGATQIWLAGRAEIDGVDGRLYAGGDALAVLRSVLDELGVPQ